MAEAPIEDSALPPKLDLRKRVAASPPAPKQPSVPTGAKTGKEPTSETMRVNAPTTTPPPGAKTIPTPTPLAAAPTPSGKEVPVPAKPIRLQAKPKAAAPARPKTATVAGQPAAVKPKSVKLKPAAVRIKRDNANTAAPLDAKRETSKIPLESATAPVPSAAPASTSPKTIKIKPAPSAPPRRTAPAPAATASGVPDPKRQTSRISLEAALGSNGEEKPSGPKTIRLKRPSDAPTVRKEKAPIKDTVGSLNKTAEILMPEGTEDKPDTQKKTIRIKRSAQRTSVKSVSVKRAGGGGAAVAAPVAVAVAAQTKATDSAHWTFITAAVVALLVACVLIYVLCAQVLGPNVSMTELAYWAPDAELPWPGRILR